MQAFRYALDEATRSLWRGRQSGILSTVTIALALFVLGAFLLVTANLQRIGDDWGSAAEMSVYLKDDLTAQDRAAIERTLGASDVVASREFISKADALARFKQTFGELTAAVDGVGENPLPASYEVRLKPGAGSGGGGPVDALAEQLRGASGVADVRYDRQWLNRLLSAVTVVRAAGFVLAALLTIAAALTVANVVRLALYARRDELEIMELVGAPGVYVRGPFVMEGVLQGGMGALAALALLAVAFFGLRARYLAPAASAINLPPMEFLPIGLCLLLVVGGMAVGCVGGLVATRSE
jgi:cell division transport system permease protein